METQEEKGKTPPKPAQHKITKDQTSKFGSTMSKKMELDLCQSFILNSLNACARHFFSLLLSTDLRYQVWSVWVQWLDLQTLKQNYDSFAAPQSSNKFQLCYQDFKNSVYEFIVYEMWPLLSEIFKSVRAGEDCRLTELKLCSYICNICPHQLAQGTWAPRAGRVPWKAELLGLTAALLCEQHSSTSTHWLLHDTLVPHCQTQSPPTQLSTPF